MLKSTGPQAHSTDPAIKQKQISRIREAIRTRFILHEELAEDEETHFICQIHEMNDEALFEFSKKKLKSLIAKLSTLPSCLTRKRVYMDSSFRLPEPALPYPGSSDAATMLVRFQGCHLEVWC
jgi:hypothetical protein